MSKNATSTELHAEEKGREAFKAFSAGPWPFKDRKTPKNPHARDTKEYADWRHGYDAEMCAWFA